MESHAPYEAAAALADVDATRRRLADRAASTWWFRAASGLVMAGAFALVAVGPTTVSLWAPATAVLVLQALAWLLARVTGVSVHRYGRVPATRWIYAAYVALFAVLFLGGVEVVRETQLPWLAVPIAIAVFVLVQATELLVDAALRRGLAA